MRIFKTKVVARFTRSEGIADASLVDAIKRAERGLIDADLGGGLFKQRVARQGQGKSGGYRMLVACRKGDRAVFFYGFAKNARSNIGDDELKTAREICAYWLNASEAQIDEAVSEKVIMEISHDDEK